MSWSSLRRWLTVIGPLLTLAVIAWRVGTEPFVTGVRNVDAKALVTASLLAVLTTICCAWRWKIVARGLGAELPLRSAVAAYYRSLFLNITLPGGVVGDVHRGLAHGRAVDDRGRALRAVVWERSAGQAVQLLITVPVLLILPSPIRPAMPWVALGALVVGAIVLAGLARPHGTSAWARGRRLIAGDLRHALLARHAWPPIAVASTLIVVGHAATFVLAARTAGAVAPLSRIVPIGLLAMTAMTLPSIGGWGPREGVTAWAFGAAGLGVQQGLATAVVYGVLVFAATLPGAVVLAVTWQHGDRAGQAAGVTRMRRLAIRVKQRLVHV
jgi:glycosyltransferase 2 family protein